VNKRVLVVDDVAFNCKIIATHLSKFAIPADIATSGEEAVAACIRTHYTVVLMDLDMPGMDGYQATRLIRQHEASVKRHTPILAVSSFDKPDDRLKCIREGLDGLLKKGLKAEELLCVINSYDLEDTGSRFPSSVAQRTANEHLGMSADIAQLQYRFEGKTTELVSEFIFFSRGLIDEFERVIGNRSSIGLTHVSYSLKGACSNLGLTTMANICAEIADDGYAGHWHRVAHKYRTICSMIDEVLDATIDTRPVKAKIS
jgi:CheY-like chemotaxis protein